MDTSRDLAYDAMEMDMERVVGELCMETFF